MTNSEITYQAIKRDKLIRLREIEAGYASCFVYIADKPLLVSGKIVG